MPNSKNPSKKSSRAVGDELEKEVHASLNDAWTTNENGDYVRVEDCGFNMTAGSGSKWQDGDLRHHRVVVECKVKNSVKGFTAPASELRKLIAEAGKQGKEWLYVEQNADGRLMVCMDLSFFCEVSAKWRQDNAR